MTRLIHAELFRLRTTRTTWALLLGTLALVGLVLFPALDRAGTGSHPSLGTPHSLQTILAAPRSALYFAVLLGILAFAGEYRHRTITSTFLATPRRGRVVLAKLVAYGLAGLGFGAVVVAAAYGAAYAWHRARAVPLDLLQADVVRTGSGLAVATALFAMIGVGVGALVRNQAIAMVGAIVWLQIVELGVLTGFAPQLFPWTANGAAFALTQIEPPSRLLVVLPPVQGALLLTAYGLVAALVAAAITVRRDVT